MPFHDNIPRPPNPFKKAKDLLDAPVDKFQSFLQAIGEAIASVGEVVLTVKDIVVYVAAGFVSLLRAGFDGIVDIAKYVSTAIVNMLRAGFDGLGDVARFVSTAIVNMLRTGFDAIRDVAVYVAGAIANMLRDSLSKASDLLAFAAAGIANIVRDGLNKLADLVQWFGTGVLNTAKEGAERVGGSLDDVGGALKDLPGAAADATGNVIETLFGFGPDLFNGMADLGERIMRGEIATTDQLLAEIRGRAPESTILERIAYIPVNITSVLSFIAAGAQARAEIFVQDIRKEFPSTLLDPSDLRDAQLRKILSEDAVHEQLDRYGYSDDNIAAIRKLWQEIPPPSDLIRMAVREAFTPEIVAEFQLHGDFPDRFAELAEQQGISRDFALAYWAAHWSLPSATQGFEMFHRDVITAEQLDRLLRALDVMPFWRERLTAIAYNVVTRVDTRRLYSAGVWDRARVERSYLDQGYKPEDAAALTEWTVQSLSEDSPSARDLTRTAVEKSYKQGRIDRAEAIARLVELGYDEDEADFFISNVDVDIEAAAAADAERAVRDLTQGTVLRAYKERIIPSAEASALLADLGYTEEGVELLLAVQDFDVENELTNLRAKVVEQRFKKQHIGADEARAELAGAGVGVDRADLIVQRWEVQFAEKTRELTPAELERALEKGVMDPATYVDRLLALGYSEEDAQTKLALTDVGDAEGARELSAGSIIGAYKRAILSRETTLERLIAIGLAGDDAELLLRSADVDLERQAQLRADREERAAAAAIRDLSNSTIAKAWKRNLITEAEAIARLVDLGFREGDARLFLETQSAPSASAGA